MLAVWAAMAAVQSGGAGMTDEERKQFINEYCRNVGNIKIKCDDCKFVDDCVDYGWQECKKFTQIERNTQLF